MSDQRKPLNEGYQPIEKGYQPRPIFSQMIPPKGGTGETTTSTTNTTTT